MKKYLSLSVVVILLIGILCGCVGDKEFTKSGLTITLPAHFQDLSDESFAADMEFCYGFSPLAVIGLKEQKADIQDYMEEVTLRAYGELIVSLNGFSCELIEKDGLLTFEYDADVDGTSYTYLGAVYETEDSFWTVQTYCPTSIYAKNQEAMMGYLKSVVV